MQDVGGGHTTCQLPINRNVIAVDKVADADFRVHDPAVRGRKPHQLFGAQRLLVKVDCGGSPIDDQVRNESARFLMLWIVWHVGVFSLSQTKQDLYIYPVMPAIAALGGMAIATAAPGVRPLSAVIGFLFAAAGAGVLYVFNASNNFYELDAVDTFALLAIAAVVIAGVRLAR